MLKKKKKKDNRIVHDNCAIFQNPERFLLRKTKHKASLYLIEIYLKLESSLVIFH